MSEKLWYYLKGQTPEGPIPEARLRAMLANGEITPETRVWAEGMTEWAPASILEYPPPPSSPGPAPRQRHSSRRPPSLASVGCRGCLGCIALLVVVVVVALIWNYYAANMESGGMTAPQTTQSRPAPPAAQASPKPAGAMRLPHAKLRTNSLTPKQAAVEQWAANIRADTDSPVERVSYSTKGDGVSAYVYFRRSSALGRTAVKNPAAPEVEAAALVLSSRLRDTCEQAGIFADQANVVIHVRDRYIGTSLNFSGQNVYLPSGWEKGPAE